MKRAFDVAISLLALLLALPILLVFTLLIWLQDGHSPFYVASRVGRGRKPFRMVKLRSMVIRADQIGGTSTSGDDRRITLVGRMIRRYKLDEISQFWNVLKGDMSVVGPRPNTEPDVALYTDEEMHLLDVKPGITDFSSIVFSDESEILRGSADPDLKYNQVIRPYKSRLGLFYIRHQGVGLDTRLVALTAVAIVSRARALRGVQRALRRLGADPALVEVAARSGPLAAAPPPGASAVVAERARMAERDYPGIPESQGR